MTGDSKFGPMDQFTMTAVVIGVSDFTNFRFPAKVSDLIVTDTSTCSFINVKCRGQMFDG